jgi:hypothetical protein
VKGINRGEIHLLKSWLEDWEFPSKLQYVPTREQVADILTMALMKGKFVFFRNKLGVV